MIKEEPLDRCPRCKAVYSLTWDTLQARIVFCNCTSGFGANIEEAKARWIAEFKHKERKARKEQ